MRAPLPQKTGNGFARSGGRLLQQICGVTRPVLVCSPPMLVVSIEVRTGHVCLRPREQVCYKPTSRAYPYFSQESVSPLRIVLLGPVFGSVVPTLPLLFSKGTAGTLFFCRVGHVAISIATSSHATRSRSGGRQHARCWTRALVSPSRGLPYLMEKRACAEVTDVTWASLPAHCASLQRGPPCQTLTQPQSGCWMSSYARAYERNMRGGMRTRSSPLG